MYPVHQSCPHQLAKSHPSSQIAPRVRSVGIFQEKLSIFVWIPHELTKKGLMAE